MPDDRKDSKWLQGELIDLWLKASRQDPVDASACAKIADLLSKMLPRSEETDPREAELDELRRQLREGTAHKG